MSVGSFISRRLSLRQGVDGKRLAPSISVAIGGIALSFFVMMVSIAIVTGFKNEITRKIMGFDAQITLTPLGAYYGDGSATAVFDGGMREVVKDAFDEVGITADSAQVFLSFSQAGLIKTDDDFMGVAFRCFGDGYGWSFERGNLSEGSLPPDKAGRGMTISAEMARKLHLAVGDRVNVYFFSGDHVRPRKFDVEGIYSSDFGDYDNMVAYASWNTLARLAGYDSADEGACIEICGIGDADIEPLAHALQGHLNSAFATGAIDRNYLVSTVYASGAMYFNWLAMLDTNIVVILVLMGCVSGFMLIACVLILILERVRMVGMLKALGAADRLIKDIFMRLGIRVVSAGLLIGNVAGWLFVWLQGRWHLLPLDPGSYYMSYVPVDMPVSYWLALNVGVAAFALALMLIPTAIISRLSVVRVLRFE